LEPAGLGAEKNLLVVASYIVYGAWNPPFAALLFSTTCMDFWLGHQIAKAQGPHRKRRWFVASVCMNLSTLGFFKSGNFLLQNFQWLLSRIGIVYQSPHLDILLPVGISFYTFHSLSYTLDIYRGVLQPTRSLCDFVLAVSFFPQLVAGPIVRAGDFLPQLAHPPRLKEGQFFWGLALMTLGLFEKIVLADTLLFGSADRVGVVSKHRHTVDNDSLLCRLFVPLAQGYSGQIHLHVRLNTQDRRPSSR
jgi:alginate O-acetyltransferase complex protein AlgI